MTQTTLHGHHLECTDLPSTEQLLVMGGDERVALDAQHGMNKYGCRPLPDPALSDFASATASVISESGYQSAERLRQRLCAALRAEPHASVYARELDRVRGELLDLCELGDMARSEVIFAASGTDLHTLAAQLAQVAAGKPVLAIMVDKTETGSKVLTALSRDSHPSSGTTPGNLEIATVSLRHADGSPRLASDIDADFAALSHRAIANGSHVLLIHVNLSKTGMIAPSHDCVATLQGELGDQLSVLVDACQFRISPGTLRAYLAQGYWVALTGSKFVGGPSFSGALLIPAASAQKIRQHPLPRLGHFSALAEWPASWNTQGALKNTSNFGLLLRWEAALTELRAFRTIPEKTVTGFVQKFADAVHERLASDATFAPIPVPALDSNIFGPVKNWDSIQTIFPFQLYDSANPADRMPLDMEATMRIYRLLSQDLSGSSYRLPPDIAAQRHQLSQPAVYGCNASGEPLGALRLCLGSRLIVRGTAQNGAGADAVIKQAQAALDKAAILARMFHRGRVAGAEY